MKVSVVIPMQQHSYRTAIGLIRNGFIDKYHTTIYYRTSLKYRILGLILPSSFKKRMLHRCNPELDGFVMTHAENALLFQTFASRVHWLLPLSKKIRESCFTIFAKSVAKYYKCNRVDAIWTFDSWSLAVYKEFNRQGVGTIKILDMASTATPTIKQIIDDEVSKNEDFSYTFNRNRNMYSDANISRYIQEFKLADYFLSPSRWVNSSLINAGISPEKIIMLPHGVDCSTFSPKGNEYVVPDRLRFLFVGRVEAAKGIRYLFDAFRQLQSENIELIVVGNTYTWHDEVASYSPNIKVLGLKRQDEMPAIYQQADVFILSSLWEGSALSMLEAMSAGMPVIASSHSCAPDIIQDGKQGFVYDPYDVEKLKELILWYANHKETIIEMGRNARKTAEENSWERYYENVAKVVKEIQKRENID